MAGSVAFDRAAEFYDRTRGISEAAMAGTIQILRAELADRGPALEVGVGTGLLALPLHRAGVPVVGMDLARPMLDKLAEKAGGLAPLPLVQGDATAMPFRDGAFGAAYLRWVLHLIPGWRRALAEVARVLGPGGRFVASLGAYDPIRTEVQERFGELAGSPVTPAGLGWGAYDQLDEAMRALGATARARPTIHDEWVGSIDGFLQGIEEARYSWTWGVLEDARRRAVTELRPRLAERHGDLAAERSVPFELVWQAYDLG